MVFTAAKRILGRAPSFKVVKLIDHALVFLYVFHVYRDRLESHMDIKSWCAYRYFGSVKSFLDANTRSGTK